MRAISDSSPLILLAKIEQFDLLRELFGEVLIPPAVFEEVVSAGTSRAGARHVRESIWLQVCPLPDRTRLTQLPPLGAGESEVIALGQSLTDVGVLVLDDFRARGVAKQLGLPLVGTAGLALLAKRQGIIDRVEPFIRDLIDAGLRLSPHEFEKLLSAAGESSFDSHP